MHFSNLMLRASALRPVTAILVSAFLALVGTALHAAEPEGRIVKVENGSLRGLQQKGVQTFLGIPYGKSTGGDMRWKPPVPAKSWTGVRAATAPAPVCFQGKVNLFGPYTPEFMIDDRNMSEDCLYLNVWTPAKRANKLPVLFYIHGGGFGEGSGTIPIYNGEGLASRGAVVVTINYRLGAFGFLAHPELTAEAGTSGNYGIQDMVAALKWVQANISSFGGDSQKVTIVGQSAGAAAVNALLFAPQAKGLFQRAVAMSGSGPGFPMTTFKDAQDNGIKLQTKAGVASLKELRALPAQAIYEASKQPPMKRGEGLPPIGFGDIADGVTLVATGSSLGEKIQSPVPLMTGFLADEAFMPGADQLSPTEFEADLQKRFGGMAERFSKLYPHATGAEAQQSYRLLARDRSTFNVLNWAQDRTSKTGQPIYIYLYDHPYPAADGKDFGAFHTSEVPILMGALGLGGRNFTDKDRAVSRQMQDHWLALMKNAAPGISKDSWRPVDATSKTVMGLGDTYGPRQAVSTQERYEAFRDFVAGGGKLTLF